MPEIPPPPLVPSTPEPSPEVSSRRESLFPKLKKWGGVVGVIVTLGGGVGTVWKTAVYINTLHDTIVANKVIVQGLQDQMDEDHDELTDNIGMVAVAIRAQRDHDLEIITSLRIAVAALQAAQDVRAGRVSYGGVQNDRLALATPESPPRASVRREQAALAEEDASAALRRAARAQATADHADPLAALEGL